jgi:perosamine synthetase
LHALGIGPGDLVVCPAVSFVATANVIAYCGAEPLFLDIDPSNLGLDAHCLERFFAEECIGSGSDLRHAPSARRIAAVMAVHLFGHPADIERLVDICDERQVCLIEDAAEALGSCYQGRACGTFGHAGIVSFNGNKIVTTGGGGAILTSDAKLAARLKHLATTAKISHGWEYDHDEIAFNYRLPSLNAAIGCAQLERLDDFLDRKRRLASIIKDALGSLAGASLIQEPAGANSNFWLNGLLLDRAAMRPAFLDETNSRGIRTRPCWRLLSDLPMYRTALIANSGISLARDRAGRLVNIPSSANLVGNG